MADGAPIEWADDVCETCRQPFDRRTGNTRYCSRRCYGQRPGIRSDAVRERARTNAIQRIWYGPQRDALRSIEGTRCGQQAELSAVCTVLPALGFSGIVNLSARSHGSPVDFVAVHGGMRSLVDVTTKWQKHIDNKVSWAEAIGFPLFIVMISPRGHRFYWMERARPRAKSIRVPTAYIRHMARTLEERFDG